MPTVPGLSLSKRQALPLALLHPLKVIQTYIPGIAGSHQPPLTLSSLGSIQSLPTLLLEIALPAKYARNPTVCPVATPHLSLGNRLHSLAHFTAPFSFPSAKGSHRSPSCPYSPTTGRKGQILSRNLQPSNCMFTCPLPQASARLVPLLDPCLACHLP